MADLSTVYTFFNNPDAHAAFLHRVEAALVQKALDVRAEAEPEPMTAVFAARQQWAWETLRNPHNAARTMLPALAVKANDIDRISEEGEISATDSEIRAAITNLIGPYSAYIPQT